MLSIDSLGVDFDTEPVITFEEAYEQCMEEQSLGLEEINWSMIGKVAVAGAVILMVAKIVQIMRKEMEVQRKKDRLLELGAAQVAKDASAFDFYHNGGTHGGVGLESVGEHDYFKQARMFLTNPLVYANCVLDVKVNPFNVYDLRYLTTNFTPTAIRSLRRGLESKVTVILDSMGLESFEPRVDTSDVMNREWGLAGIDRLMSRMIERLSDNQDPMYSQTHHKASTILSSVIGNNRESKRECQNALEQLTRFTDELNEVGEAIDRSYRIRVGEDRMRIVNANMDDLVRYMLRNVEGMKKFTQKCIRRQEQLILNGLRGVMAAQAACIRDHERSNGDRAYLSRLNKHYDSTKKIVRKLEKALR